jgi:hypothetical protein
LTPAVSCPQRRRRTSLQWLAWTIDPQHAGSPGGSVAVEAGGELRLRSCPIVRPAEPAARLGEVCAEDAHRQRGHNDDGAGEAIQSRRQRPYDPGLMNPDELAEWSSGLMRTGHSARMSGFYRRREPARNQVPSKLL